MRTDKEIETLAKAHCDYLITVFVKAFVDGFIHGYKHGRKEREEYIERTRGGFETRRKKEREE